MHRCSLASFSPDHSCFSLSASPPPAGSKERPTGRSLSLLRGDGSSFASAPLNWSSVTQLSVTNVTAAPAPAFPAGSEAAFPTQAQQLVRYIKLTAASGQHLHFK